MLDTANAKSGAGSNTRPLSPNQGRSQNPLGDALRGCRAGFIGVFFFSLIMNVLMLTGPFFMLQVYDRVLTSQSIPTLAALSILVVALFMFFGFFDFVRARLMSRIAALLDLELADLSFAGAVRAGPAGGEVVRDLRAVRHFVSGPAATGLFDVPWMPIYVGVVFLLHPFLGWMAVGGALILLAIAFINEFLSRTPAHDASVCAAREDRFVASSRRCSETVNAMGMLPDLTRVWRGEHSKLLDATQTAGDRVGAYSSMSRTLRMMLQSSILGIGAYFVIQNELSPGALIAASIIFARALAPVDATIAQWRSVASARQSWGRLRETIRAGLIDEQGLELRTPTQSLVLEGLSVAAPRSPTAIVKNVSMAVGAGDGVGIIGASGSGKSTLLRGIVGAWPTRGEVRIDGATPDQWTSEARGRFVGYLPQDIELLGGTIADNIARFREDANSESVIDAAELAGVHKLIVSLPDGYNTLVGEGGVALSAGQRQRVGLARAVYGNPFLVVLDEPNSNLDMDGELALSRAIAELRKRKSIVVIAAHRKAAIDRVNKLLYLVDGSAVEFGEKERVLEKITTDRPPQPAR